MNKLIEEVKQLIIETLDLEDIATGDIATNGQLFGKALGLDSIDALELGMEIQKRYKVKLDANAEDTRTHFESVASLVAFIEDKQAA